MLERVKKTLYWQNFLKYADKTDENGYILGTYPEYGEVQTTRANISTEKGEAVQEMFGALKEYDRVLLVRHQIDMNENSLVWLDGAKPPQPHNYIVLRKAISNNYTAFALQRVELGDNTDDGAEGD